jgi:hypothetical protein
MAKSLLTGLRHWELQLCAHACTAVYGLTEHAGQRIEGDRLRVTGIDDIGLEAVRAGEAAISSYDSSQGTPLLSERVLAE